MYLLEWREFPSAPCLAGKKKLDDSSRLGVVEIVLPNLFPSWSGYGLISTPVYKITNSQYDISLYIVCGKNLTPFKQKQF